MTWYFPTPQLVQAEAAVLFLATGLLVLAVPAAAVMVRPPPTEMAATELLIQVVAVRVATTMVVLAVLAVLALSLFPTQQVSQI